MPIKIIYNYVLRLIGSLMILWSLISLLVLGLDYLINERNILSFGFSPAPTPYFVENIPPPTQSSIKEIPIYEQKVIEKWLKDYEEDITRVRDRLLSEIEKEATINLNIALLIVGFPIYLYNRRRTKSYEQYLKRQEEEKELEKLKAKSQKPHKITKKHHPKT